MKYFSCALVLVFAFAGFTCLAAADLPNILWVTSEDNGPHLGCYGDEYADTPNIDALAKRGMIYLNAWSTAPVCAPARTTIISGMYPPSTGAEHMRSMTRLPSGFRMYPQYLREAGYYCTNNRKEDYNLEKPGKVWDESSPRAHWRNREPGQPFFAIFNYTVSHESRIRQRPHRAIHDPARVRVPAYHPDAPDVRQDWAQYHDKLTEMDALVGKSLKELADAGLADNTIIFYYGDHGSGMPRSKRYPYNSGLHVPLVIHVPEKLKHLAPDDYAVGGKTDRLVGFIDLAPTVLSLAGIKPPEHFQGYAFMGRYAAAPPPYIYGFRGRMDERYDMIRTVRDGRFIYLRNYMPHKIYGQYVRYMFQTPTTRVWKRLHDEGKLSAAQSAFWKRKPPEELYDLQNDPDEVNNLAGSEAHQAILARMRAAQRELAWRIRDVGFLPEDEIHSRARESTPYEVGHSGKVPLKRIMSTAELASSLDPGAVPALGKALRDDDSAVRYWAAMGILMRQENGVKAARASLRSALSDASANVRVIAAQALGEYGDAEDLAKALPVLLEAADLGKSTVFVAMLALNALDALDRGAASVQEKIASLPTGQRGTPRRIGGYVPRLIEKITADLEAGS